jgi:hypothetical protein
MPLSHSSAAYKTTLPYQKPAPTVKFGQISMQKALGMLVDDGPATLVAIDIFGMGLPRTIESFVSRGQDDARETFLRENFGTLGNMFVMGGASLGLMKLAGRTVNRFNPRGIPAPAFIQAETLDTFSDLYVHALKNTATPDLARKQFIQLVLSGLESSDRQNSLIARLQGIQKLATFPKEQKQLLEATLKLVFGEEHALQHLPEAQRLLRLGREEDLLRLKDKLLNPKGGSPGWGRLSDKARETLLYMYNLDKQGTDSGKGTFPLDAMASNPKERLKLSLSRLVKKNGRSSVDWIAQTLDRFAQDHGLTSTVHLKQDQVFILDKSRKNVLTELLHFLEQFVDRAAHNSQKQPDWKAAVQNRLYHQDKSSWLNRVIPSVKDGFVTAAQKSKLLYTWVPVVATLISSGVLVFFNNWYTRHKYHGKIFFPGEGVPSTINNTAREKGNGRLSSVEARPSGFQAFSPPAPLTVKPQRTNSSMLFQPSSEAPLSSTLTIRPNKPEFTQQNQSSTFNLIQAGTAL